MKTKKSCFLLSVLVLSWSTMCPPLSNAQDKRTAEAENKPTDSRPEKSDASSLRLVNNYLTATGGRSAHRALQNVVAVGTIKESTLQRNFTLIETADGKRHLTYHWTHLGRKHRVVYVHDGVQTWTQVLEPKKQDAQAYSGADGIHFASQRWLLQPFTLPTLADYTFRFNGTTKVSGRSAYVVKGYGRLNRESWFYFDKEKFLLIRWGGDGQIAGIRENLDYRATQFKKVGGVLLPSQIDLLAEDAAFGKVRFESVKVNQNLKDVSFNMPPSTTPILRQRPVQQN